MTLSYRTDAKSLDPRTLLGIANTAPRSEFQKWTLAIEDSLLAESSTSGLEIGLHIGPRPWPGGRPGCCRNQNAIPSVIDSNGL